MTKVREFLKRGPLRSRRDELGVPAETAVTVPAPGDDITRCLRPFLHKTPVPAMYQTFFDLARAPFPASPDPASLVIYGDLGDQLRELAGCLTSGQGIAVLTGPPGSGKTLCTLAMTRDLTSSLVGICLRTGQFNQPRELLKSGLHGLGHPFRQQDDQDLRLAVADAIHGLPSTSNGVLLAVDEAHRLGMPVLEELRGLTNLDANGRPLVRLLLAGQCDLEEKLADPQLDGLYQRVRGQARLQPLTRGESQSYLKSRIRFAGGDPGSVMTDEAVELLAIVCDGSPRCLNHLADASLQRGAWSATRPITRGEVLDALTESRQLPLRFVEPSRPSVDTTSAPIATGPVEMIQTEDGFCSVEVGAGDAATDSPPAADTAPATDGVIGDPAARSMDESDDGHQTPTDEKSVDVTAFDVVLPEANSPHGEHDRPRPHMGLFSRLRRATNRSTDETTSD